MPQTSVVMVTMHENPDYLFEAIKAGAAGYVLKDAPGERLLRAGNSSGKVAGASEPAANHLGGQAEGQLEILTPRMIEVLKLLSQRQTNPQIAQNLLFSVSTVKAHVRSILTKLGVSDRTQAAVRAIEFTLTYPGMD